MPRIYVNGADIYYEEKGSGSETVVFAHGLLWSGRMFSRQVDALKNRYRCVTFDFRGQGQSGVTESGYDMDALAEDAASLIRAIGCQPCHFAGLSMGGFIGMRLAICKPDLIRSLILMETSADPESFGNKIRYRVLNLIARRFGLKPVADQVMPIMFGEKFLKDPDRAGERAVWRRRMIANDRIGITRAAQGVIDRRGVYEELHRISVPTLIIVGDQDAATVPAKSERIHARISGSKLVFIPGAGHSSTIEEPETVNTALEDFLRSGMLRH
ncbi:alpha/beta fold hydrolase [Desulfobacterales bacterium HSG2]|nr:alpha/beta fold hydrolase [Desulfobacterales bacterium HSG2]